MTFSWDDVTVFLALYRERMTTRAASALGCSQPTVVRRIAVLEAAIGLTLFERTPSRFEPSEAAMAALRAAQNIEVAVCEFEAEASSQRGETTQLICLTRSIIFENLVLRNGGGGHGRRRGGH